MDSNGGDGSSVGGDDGAEAEKSSVVKPYNNYNIFFTLERRLLIEQRMRHRASPTASLDGNESVYSSAMGSAAGNNDDDAPITGYEDLELPPLPPRYQLLAPSLPRYWFVPGRNKNAKRKHQATHRLASFKELAKSAAETWRNIDPVTKEFAETVAKIQKDRYDELREMEKRARKVQAKKKEGQQMKARQQEQLREQQQQLRHEHEDHSNDIGTSNHSMTSASSCQPPDYYHYPPPPPPPPPQPSSEYQNSYGTDYHHEVSSYYNPPPSHHEHYQPRNQYMQEEYSAQRHYYQGRTSAPNGGPEYASSSQAFRPDAHPSIPQNESLSLDQLFSNFNERSNDNFSSRTRRLCEEVDVSDEEILDAFNSS